MIIRCRGWLAAFVIINLLASVAPATGKRARPQGPKVICPAINQDDEPDPSGPYDGPMPQPELVVLGKARANDKAPVKRRVTLDVEKVISGSWAAKTLQCNAGWYENDRRIFFLVPGMFRDDEPFRVRYTLDPAEEKAARALGAARLDFNSLAAKCIFVGKEVALKDNRTSTNKGQYLVKDLFQRTVKVVRPLAGPTPPKGNQLTVEMRWYFSRDHSKPVVRKGLEIYFIGFIDPKPRRSDRKKSKEAIYYGRWRQPADREADVRAALKRRDEDPVSKTAEDGQTAGSRDILFRGSTADAIDLMGSSRGAAVILGARKLLYEGAKARPAIVTAIKQRQLRNAEQARGDHRRLKNLIALLGIMRKRGQESGDLKRLIDRQMEHIAGQPAKSTEKGKRQRGEERREDVNHALTWLLQALGDEEVHRSYTTRLLRLRERSKGGWKEEVQLALDVCKVEDQIELIQALQRLRVVKPVRAGPTMHHDGKYVVAFSPCGKYLATAGKGKVRVWNTRDWSLAGQFPLSDDENLLGRSIERVRFSPDAKFLYVAGGGDVPIHGRYDWRTGKADKTYTAHKEGLWELELSRDGRRMATASEKTFQVCDTKTGKVLRSFPGKDYRTELTLSPDGKILIRARGEVKVKGPRNDYERRPPEWKVESVAGRPPKIKALQGKDSWLFSPAGRYLVSAKASRPTTEQKAGPVTLRVHDATKDYAVVARRKDAHFGTWLTISANGTRLAVTSRKGRQGLASPTNRYPFTILSLPNLKPVSTFVVKSGSHDHYLGSVALSPDGKLLAAAVDYHVTPYLFETATGKRIFPGEGHTGKVRSVHFDSAGKVLRSVCSDKHLCRWVVATMRLLGRVTLPNSYKVLSIHPDGKFLACRDAAGPKDNKTIKILDADTARDRFALTCSDKEYSDSCVWSGDHEVVYCSGKRLFRCDYQAGKVLKEVKLEKESISFQKGSAELDAHGKSLYWMNTRGERRRMCQAWSIDLDTGKIHSIAKVGMDHHAGKHGLVPGGKYVYLADPHVYLLDRQTLRVAARREFRKTDLLDITFTGDGRHYAVVTGGRILIDLDRLQRRDPRTPSLVRVHETLSGKTVGAFRASTRWIKIRFAPDGRRLAVINDDDTIEVWDLSAGDQ
jgi:WD40 repeat protein